MARMAGFQGFSERLQTPQDLVEKLRHDLARVRRNPRDAYAAFDYFVTADSLVDWLGLNVHYNDPPSSASSGAERQCSRQASVWRG